MTKSDEANLWKRILGVFKSLHPVVQTALVGGACLVAVFYVSKPPEPPRQSQNQSGNDNIQTREIKITATSNATVNAGGTQINNMGGSPVNNFGGPVLNVTVHSNIVNFSDNVKTGVLKPRFPSVATDGFSGVGLNNNILTISTEADQTYLPFGGAVPFAITTTLTGIEVTAEFRTLEGIMIAELYHNEWRPNPNAYFKINFDSSALEVVEQRNIPWVQVEYLSPTKIRLGGVFHSGQLSFVAKHPEFRHVHREVLNGLGWGMLAVVNDRGWTASQFTPAKNMPPDYFEKLWENIDRQLAPWFDYTPSKGFGVRLSSSASHP